MMNIIQTKYGMVQGTEINNYTVFKGIPYAKPPTGDLRFRYPVETNAWDGIYRADKFPPACMQAIPEKDDFYYKEFGAAKNFSEDSLYLNVWTPAADSDAMLPVAVWLYGGACIGGYCAEKEFDGAEYASRGVILVTLNYRLGLFGFMCHPLLAEENNGSCGNYGIFDQIASLKWVKENIKAFGGDPDNITLFGQSAGSLTAQTLLLSPLTKGLFNKCIFQSGAGYENGFCKNRVQEEFYDIGEKAFEQSGAKSLEELRKLPAERLLEISSKLIEYACQTDKGLGYEPVIDGRLLTGDSEQNLREGNYPDIPIMLGSTANDICTPPGATVPMEESILHNGCVNWCKHQNELGYKPPYLYYFKRRLPGDDYGAFHSSELWYMFGTLNRCWRPFTPEDESLSRRMLDYWCNFIRTGNPNGDGLEEWTPWTRESRSVMIFL